MEICDDCGCVQASRNIIHISTHTLIDASGKEVVAEMVHICAKCTIERFGKFKQ